MIVVWIDANMMFASLSFVSIYCLDDVILFCFNIVFYWMRILSLRFSYSDNSDISASFSLIRSSRFLIRNSFSTFTLVNSPDDNKFASNNWYFPGRPDCLILYCKVFLPSCRFLNPLLNSWIYLCKLSAP